MDAPRLPLDLLDLPDMTKVKGKARAAILRWAVLDHCCARCGGRVLARVDDAGVRVYRCATCDHIDYGTTAKVICACGMRIAGRDAGLRCVKVESPTPAAPHVIEAREIR